MIITVKLSRSWNRLRLQFDAMPDTAHDAVLEAVTRMAFVMRDRMIAKASGGVLQRRSGRLARSIRARVSDSRRRIQARVGTGVRYAAIQEYGGVVPAHEIDPRHGGALAFEINGAQRFAARVHMPAVRLAARFFARSSLDELEPEIVEALENAVRRAIGVDE